MKILKLLKLADYVTLCNAVVGVLALYFFTQQRWNIGMLLIFFGVVLDFFDGFFARKQGSSKLGPDLDSLADSITFGVAPAFFGMLYFSNHPLHAPLLFCALFFALCGILRLSRFNALPRKTGFEGMPITLNGILFPLVFFSMQYFVFSFFSYLFMVLYLVLGVLMISSVPIKKVQL